MTAMTALKSHDLKVLDQVHEGYFSLDEQWRITHINRAAEDYWHLRREEAIGDVFWDRFVVLRNTEVEARFRETMESGRHAEFDWVSAVRPGRYLEVTVDRTQEGIAVLFRDLTERRLVEDSLKQTEVRYQLLFEAARDLSSSLEEQDLFQKLRSLVLRVLPCDGLIVSSFNPEEGLIRCGHAWTVGSTLDPATLPPIPLGPEGSGMQSQVIRSGKAMLFADVNKRVKHRTGQFYNVEPDGSVREFEEGEEAVTHSAMMIPLKLEGQVTGVVQVMCHQENVYTQDHLSFLEALVSQFAVAVQNARLYKRAMNEIKERWRAEEAWRQSERRYQALVDVTTHAVWHTDYRGMVMEPIPQWQAMTGLTWKQTKGAGWMRAVHPDDMERSLAAWRHAVATASQFEIEHRVRLASGEFRWMLARGVPVLDADAHIREWVGAHIDIQDRKVAEETLEQTVRERTAELEAANREMEGFTYSVSHDLRGPLRAIVSTSRILMEDYVEALPAAAQDQLNRQAKAANKMGALIDDLLKLSRLSRSELQTSDIDITAMAAEIADELMTSYARCAVQFEIQEGLHARGDAKLVRLALHNLMENACKFSPSGGVVKVGSRNGVLYVRDQGIGFDAKYAHKMFLPFERLVSDTEFPGTGIGLANVKRIAERHGGDVTAESEGPNRGATFYLAL